jgi:hypothetical protein
MFPYLSNADNDQKVSILGFTIWVIITCSLVYLCFNLLRRLHQNSNNETFIAIKGNIRTVKIFRALRVKFIRFPHSYLVKVHCYRIIISKVFQPIIKLVVHEYNSTSASSKRKEL